MKLKNLAALMFRMLGALFILSSIEPLAFIGESHAIIGAIAGTIMSAIIGYCLIVYSKKLAALFCKGLDDHDT